MENQGISWGDFEELLGSGVDYVQDYIESSGQNLRNESDYNQAVIRSIKDRALQRERDSQRLYTLLIVVAVLFAGIFAISKFVKK